MSRTGETPEGVDGGLAGHRYSNPFSMIVKKSRTFFLHRVKKPVGGWYCSDGVDFAVNGFSLGEDYDDATELVFVSPG